MDSQLKAEIELILQMKDEELQKNVASKIAVYLLTLPLPSEEYKDLLQCFTDRIFKILPASSIPRLLKEKLGLNKSWQRRILFADTHVHILPKVHPLSLEGREQQLREAGTLSITNTDVQRKFIPKQAFSQGLPGATKSIDLLPSTLSNRFCPEVNEKIPFRFSKPKITIQQILDNPLVLKEFE
ncbi:uncharacterized protein VICG_01319 [Vittaforma corneae ATCC 50505]|uniref:Uncharacterized protein n=1 Tax=Vittaforma corneae (strain ATCC 50505) TaxID=993615 RepID=L2GLG3_VITCO|nr:uncharacterized protein VICG_01319 [Vittaforma corneae ATCC 50505]ELA41686.1 hypothetical protein VICG_01319 [Vittaforma corneae ATCC 50505]